MLYLLSPRDTIVRRRDYQCGCGAVILNFFYKMNKVIYKGASLVYLVVGIDYGLTIELNSNDVSSTFLPVDE